MIGSEYTYSQCIECGDCYIDNKGYVYCPYCGSKLDEQEICEEEE